MPSEDNASWKQCISTPRPKLSIYHYCENTFDLSSQRENCKLDSCLLCCIMSQEFDHIEVNDDVINQCNIACIENFQDIYKEVIEN